MKMHLISDLHAGFRPFELPETDADVLVLAGDIDVGFRGMEMARRWSTRLPVVYVAGNHEYYGEAIPRHTERLATAAEDSDVHFLENQAVEIHGVRFLGCTLWTDFDLFGERVVAMASAQAAMNDFRNVRVSPEFRRLRPQDLAALHTSSLRWLIERLDEPFPGPTVVITHHAPSIRSCRAEQSDPVTAAFASDLEWMLDGKAAPWLHGHTHLCCDYEIGGTRVVANQRGYPGEVTGFDAGRTIELPCPDPP